jgi:speckle-type POZ protein
MEWLKLICEDILCRHINVSTATTMLSLAEQHRR